MMLKIVFSLVTWRHASAPFVAIFKTKLQESVFCIMCSLVGIVCSGTAAQRLESSRIRKFMLSTCTDTIMMISKF